VVRTQGHGVKLHLFLCISIANFLGHTVLRSGPVVHRHQAHEKIHQVAIKPIQVLDVMGGDELDRGVLADEVEVSSN
jgi:hypothetical protein